MMPPIRVDSYAVESVEARMHERVEKTKVTIEFGVDGVEVRNLTSTEATSEFHGIEVRYRHVIRAKRLDSDVLVYEVALEVRGRVIFNEKFMSKDADTGTQIDAALSCLMPSSGASIRAISHLLGVNPVPTVQLYGERDQ